MEHIILFYEGMSGCGCVGNNRWTTCGSVSFSWEKKLRTDGGVWVKETSNKGFDDGIENDGKPSSARKSRKQRAVFESATRTSFLINGRQ